MGAGNWYPSGDHEHAFYAWIEPENIYGEYSLEESKYDCQDDSRDLDALQWRFSEALDQIRSLLPASYYNADRWHRHDEHVVAENRLAMLILHEDSYSRMHVALLPKDDTPHEALCRHHVAQIGAQFLDAIEDLYGPLHVRDGAWTSSVRTRSKPAIAA